MQDSSRRRDFVLGGMAVLAASDRALAADREIRTAWIGVGNRGTGLLKQSLQQPSVHIAAVCDTDANARDRAQSLAQRDSPKSFSDYLCVVKSSTISGINNFESTLTMLTKEQNRRLQSRLTNPLNIQP